MRRALLEFEELFELEFEELLLLEFEELFEEEFEELLLLEFDELFELEFEDEFEDEFELELPATRIRGASFVTAPLAASSVIA